MGLSLAKNHILRIVFFEDIRGLSFLHKVGWGTYITSIAKLAFKKIGNFVGFMKFFYSDVDLYRC